MDTIDASPGCCTGTDRHFESCANFLTDDGTELERY